MCACVCVCVCVCATPGTWLQLEFHLPVTDTVGRGKLCAYILEHNFLDFLKTILCFLSCIVFSSCPICRDSMNF